MQILTEREQLILMAAYVHGSPLDGGISANCNRVLAQALFWAGLWNDGVRLRLMGAEVAEVGPQDAATADGWYDVLIALTRQPAAERLLQGWGNLGTPEGHPAAWPAFTACGLTQEGWELAKKMLAERSELEIKPKAFFRTFGSGPERGYREQLDQLAYEDLRKPQPRELYNNGMIRPITPADIETIVALTAATDMFKPLEIVALREVLDDYFEEEMARGHVAVAWEDAGRIAGFTYYGPVPLGDRTWQLWWIAVAKNQQGLGVGSRLLRHAEDDMRRKNGRLLFIETGSAPHYEPTRHFYRKFGYEQHALLMDYYADGDSMVIFRKALEG